MRQWCKTGRDNVHHLMMDCKAVASLRRWAGVAQHQLAAFPPCLRYHGILPATSAISTTLLQRQQLLLLTACAYRALVQLQPRFSLEVAVPPALADMLGLYAEKVGLPIGRPPTLCCS